MAQPILTLTTDFGISDHYVGAMKGVILGICPRAQIVDISHEVTAYHIAEGAYLLSQAYRCFPKGTVHVAVVDPGVGSTRRAILLEGAGQFFVGPDNGVFAMVTAREKHKAREISNSRYFRHPVSRTFHGRDIFAPAGAHLAAGTPAARMGKAIHDLASLDFEFDGRAGRVLHIDRFGNVVTNLRANVFDGRAAALRIGRTTISTFAVNYADEPRGRLFLIEGSSGYLEVSMNQGSAAKKTGCKVGAAVRLVSR
jgi:S-adenosylmethionine hydrolase